MLGSTTRDAVDGSRAVAQRAEAGVDGLAPVAGPVMALLADFLAERSAELADIDPALEGVGREVAALVAAGGKGLRPAFAYWGHRATGAAHDAGVLAPAAAVELLHVFALIHDDVMDRSEERRGRPAVHTALARQHVATGMLGDPRWFGVGGAILAGDLAFVWADQLLDTAPLPAAAIDRARTVFTRLRVEVMAGQFLDLRLAGLPTADEADALNVALLKSGRYTVTRPLQLGAAIANGDDRLDAALSAYGDNVGIGFQLRDDVLGLFGDPEAMGKDALSDLREGKRTILMLRALGLADDAQRTALAAILGDDALGESEADAARQIVVETGALAEVEAMITGKHEAAVRALGPVCEPARTALAGLADFALFRSS
jgi:geranylgeranyl diphosphate synthase, type I